MTTLNDGEHCGHELSTGGGTPLRANPPSTPPTPTIHIPPHTPAHLHNLPPRRFRCPPLCVRPFLPGIFYSSVSSLFIVCVECFMVRSSFSLVNRCNLCFLQAFKGSLDRAFILPFFVFILISSYVRLDTRHWGRVSLTPSLTLFLGLHFLVYWFSFLCSFCMLCTFRPFSSVQGLMFCFLCKYKGFLFNVFLSRFSCI